MAKGERFTILEHPSDLGIEARGGTLATAFENAAAGMMSVILDTSTVVAHETRPVEIYGSDREQMLVRWLSEVLYLYDGQRFAAAEFSLQELTPTHLRATIRGEPLDAERHRTKVDVKAVTYHQLEVHDSGQRAFVRVFLDI